MLRFHIAIHWLYDMHRSMRLIAFLLLFLALPFIANAQWFSDRDNSMSPAQNQMQQALVVIMSKKNSTIGTQLFCPKAPGTILGTAHGIIDNPDEAHQQKRAYRFPAENLWGVSTFPFDRENPNWSEISENAQVYAPLLNLDGTWDPEIVSTEIYQTRPLDFAFITPDTPLSGENIGIRVLDIDPLTLTKMVKSNQLDVFLYRARTIYHANADGSPDFGRPERKMPDKEKIYDIAFRVNQECKMYREGPDNPGIISRSLGGQPSRQYTSLDRSMIKVGCPVENGVSGSPFVAEINGTLYIVAMAATGFGHYMADFTNHPNRGGGALTAHGFCESYSNICGVPCATVDEM